ncbi:MAG: hypothetical protein JNK27_11080 [Chitinophagaceae bacterium]|nr:hypothetical protein [Chitinophagaceae bacterium]
MKRLFIIGFLSVLLFGCQKESVPDVQSAYPGVGLFSYKGSITRTTPVSSITNNFAFDSIRMSFHATDTFYMKWITDGIEIPNRIFYSPGTGYYYVAGIIPYFIFNPVTDTCIKIINAQPIPSSTPAEFDRVSGYTSRFDSLAGVYYLTYKMDQLNIPGIYYTFYDTLKYVGL